MTKHASTYCIAIAHSVKGNAFGYYCQKHIPNNICYYLKFEKECGTCTTHRHVHHASMYSIPRKYRISGIKERQIFQNRKSLLLKKNYFT